MHKLPVKHPAVVQPPVHKMAILLKMQLKTSDNTMMTRQFVKTRKSSPAKQHIVERKKELECCKINVLTRIILPIPLCLKMLRQSYAARLT
jgi:hypothetical protein